MLERILLAAIITFCIYLFLNLGGKSSNTPTLDAQRKVIPGFLTQAPFFVW
mgnify:CR=1 FL=1